MPRFAPPSLTRAQILAGDPPSAHLGELARDEFGKLWRGAPDSGWLEVGETPVLEDIGAVLLGSDSDAEQASIYPVLLNHLAAGIAALTLEISRE
jgi:hypothetical protein